MPARTLPGLALSGDWPLGADGWKTGMDSNMLRLSVLVQTAVISSVASYPTSPSQGDMHRLTGTTDAGDIIAYDNGAWVNFSPFEGMSIWDIAAQTRLTYSTSSGWVAGGAMSAAAIKSAYESNADTNAFTDAEKSKLAGLSDPLFKGIHLSASALTTAHPSPEAGSYAYVDAGTGSDSELYIWDDGDSAWVLGGGGGGSLETPSTIKSKYEANPDTNAFTDAEKAKLAALDVGGGSGSPVHEVVNVAIDTPVTVDNVKTYFRCTNSYVLDLQIPQHADEPIPIGTTVSAIQAGTGFVRFFPHSSVTLNCKDQPVTARQFGVIHAIKVAENVWDVYGDTGTFVEGDETMRYVGTLDELTETSYRSVDGVHRNVGV